MPSFNKDYPGTPEKILAAVVSWQSSPEYKNLCYGRDYFKGENTTISEVVKTYYSEPKIKLDKNGVPLLDKNGNIIRFGGGFVTNPYVANYKIGYGVFKDIVSQKVSTLLDEKPEIRTNYTIPDKFIKDFGYALKVAGNKASSQKVAYIFMDYKGTFNVFDTEYCIPYYDDYDGTLKALIRFWIISTSAGTEYTYIETYESDGVTVYSTDPKYTNSKRIGVYKNKTAYKFKKRVDFLGEEIETENIELPIVILKNNEDMTSDLTTAIRSKIDAIDIVNSGYANNIEDFSELFWVVKNSGAMGADQFEDFIANIKRTKKIIVDEHSDVDTKQIIIPYEARAKFTEIMKNELVQDSGIIDTATLTGSSLTTTAIKAATMKLRQRVSDFEWHVYKAATQIIELWQKYNNATFEFEIDFHKLLIDNDMEQVEILNLIRPDISRETYLEKIKEIGLIPNVKVELQRIESEAANYISVTEQTGAGV